MMKFDVELCKFALKNNLHVEYFIWVYLRSLNSTGLHNLDFPYNKRFSKSCFERKLKSNLFYKISGNKIVLTSSKNLPFFYKSKKYSFDISVLNLFARKNSSTSDKIIVGWTSTNIKYLLICLVGCQYDSKKPYALELISEDTGQAISTIQRALKNLFVHRYNLPQGNPSPRSYLYQNKSVNLSANYNQFLLGKNTSINQ